MNLDIIFFDSWGGAWTSCPAEHPRAEAFGPSGFARELTSEELAAEGLDSERTAWGSAQDSGRLVVARECHEWDYVIPKTVLATLEVQP